MEGNAQDKDNTDNAPIVRLACIMSRSLVPFSLTSQIETRLLPSLPLRESLPY